MPLVNLTTDLKSLQYGSDRPGGGSSGLPYIISPMPADSNVIQLPTGTNPQYDQFIEFYNINKTTQDYPIRGGSLALDGESGRLTTPAGRIDRNRIKAFMEDKQRGAIFLLKQAGLQLTNPKIQVPGTLAPLSNISVTGLLETTRFYNPTGITTLQQTLVQGTGTHIPRHGVVPLYTGLTTLTYEEIVRKGNTENENRLAILAKSKLGNEQPLFTGFMGGAIQNGISTINTEILNYEGGPGSTYGVGSTVIKRATNTNNSKAYNTVAFSYDSLMNQEIVSGSERAHPRVQDFRKVINRQAGKEVQMTDDYELAFESGWGWFAPSRVGNPGQSSTVFPRIDYSKNSGQIDALNYLPPISYNANEDTPWSADANNTQDIIKFAFECLSNDVPGDAVALVFRAFLSNFSDSNQAELNNFKYLGRGETFRTYQGFDRSIGFSFKIAAFSRDEMKPLYTKLNHLVSQAYPDYSPTTGFMRGSIIKLTIGDYLYRVPGFLESINISVDDNTSWEIALDQGLGKNKDNDMRQLPQVVSVQCTFKPIHDFLPIRQTADSLKVAFIADTPKKFLGSIREIKKADQPDITRAGEAAIAAAFENAVLGKNLAFQPPAPPSNTYVPGQIPQITPYQPVDPVTLLKKKP